MHQPANALIGPPRRRLGDLKHFVHHGQLGSQGICRGPFRARHGCRFRGSILVCAKRLLCGTVLQVKFGRVFRRDSGDK